MQVNGGFEPEADVGPMITPEAKARCEQLIQAGIDQVGPRDSSYVGCVGRYQGRVWMWSPTGWRQTAAGGHVVCGFMCADLWSPTGWHHSTAG